MELEAEVNKYESALRIYRYIYQFLNFATTFFALYIIFALFNMQDIFSIIPFFEPYTGAKYSFFGTELVFETLGILLVEFFLAAVITAVRYMRKEKKDAIKLLEEKFPVLNERLRTAYDNRTTDNIIVKDLLDKITLDIKPIDPSALLDRRLLIIGIGALFLTASCSTYISVTGYHTDTSPKDLPEVIDKIPFISGDDLGIHSQKEGEGEGTKGNGSSEELFGEPAVIVVEGTEVDLKIPPGAGLGFSITDEGDERDTPFTQSGAYDPEAIASQAYYENLPEGYKNVIQSYFEELAEE